MNIVDDVLGTTTNQKNYSNNISKNDWKNTQNKDRNEIYKTMDKMAIEVSNNGEKFKKYLEIQSQFYKYSVGNCLVLLDKAPESTNLKDKKSWEEKGFTLKENAKEIKILEPKIVNERTYYNPKIVYDISQVNIDKQEEKKYSDRFLLEALLYKVDAKQEAVDELPNGEIGADYDKNSNTLYVCRGMDRDFLFKSIVQEIANYETKDMNEGELKDFNNYCISYMFCKKNGIDTSSFNFEVLPNNIKDKNDGKSIRLELENIRKNYERLNSKMIQYFENSSKEKNKNKNAQER